MSGNPGRILIIAILIMIGFAVLLGWSSGNSDSLFSFLFYLMMTGAVLLIMVCILALIYLTWFVFWKAD